MPALAVGSAWIDSMLVVQAAANRVAFNDLIAHLDRMLMGGGSVEAVEK